MPTPPSYVRAYIGLGSNLDSPLRQVKQAIAELAQLSRSRLCAVSRLYRSRPMGPADQPDYINAVAAVDTRLEPLELLDALQAIEQVHRRVRKDHWGPRTLDLDLLLYGECVIEEPRLIVPHYGMQERSFVLRPLQDIAPALVLPDGTALQRLCDGLADDGIEPLVKGTRT